MPTCNIDAAGRSFRLLGGMAVALLGSILLTLMFLRVFEHVAWWFIAGGLLLADGFMIYEGWAGWCVLRAMGVRTKM